MKNTEQLINNLIGQLEGIKRMLDDNRECNDVLIQLKATKSGLNSITNKIIQEKTLDCFSNNSDADKERLKNLIKEIINNN